MLAPLILGILACQDPPPPPQGEVPKAEARGEPKPVVVEPWDDKRAKEAVKALQRALEGKPSMRERSQALDALATGSNKNLVKPLQDIVADDASLVIRKRAAELLGNQPAKEGGKAIRKLLAHAKVTAAPPVQAELIRSLSRCGYEPKCWPELDREFERVYALDRVPVQEALLDLVVAHKEVQAIPLLLRNIDEPVPANPDDPSNPPAEYWEARWKSWQVWRGKVKEALFVLTGQRFSTAEEARAWLRKNPRR